MTRHPVPSSPRTERLIDGSDGEPPRWVWNLIGGPPSTWRRVAEGMKLREGRTGRFLLLSVNVPDAVSLGAESLAGQAGAAYSLIFSLLRTWRPDSASTDRKSAHDSTGGHPIRIWNFIPGLLDPLDDLDHRYMAFNAGRYQAVRKWLGGPDGPAHAPTATGVGHGSDGLVIHCLAADRPGIQVENPRQVPSYRYSARYGPLPPCFARGTIVPDESNPGEAMLLAGGTASVIGEDSAHPDDPEAQFEETIRNLATLIDSAGRISRPPVAVTAAERGEPLDRFRSIRLYYKNTSDRPLLGRLADAAFPRALDIELVRADLCRRSLLVEIEGTASVGVGPQTADCGETALAAKSIG